MCIYYIDVILVVFLFTFQEAFSVILVWLLFEYSGDSEDTLQYPPCIWLVLMNKKESCLVYDWLIDWLIDEWIDGFVWEKKWMC